MVLWGRVLHYMLPTPTAGEQHGALLVHPHVRPSRPECDLKLAAKLSCFVSDVIQRRLPECVVYSTCQRS